MNYDEEYTKLNSEQQLAVDTLEGPVMVLAGPGTGKTQLLSMRVANILQTTGVSPDNILCLTFTEAGASNMVKRMEQLFGKDAYSVEVNTFHGFASKLINQFQEYFYKGLEYAPMNDLEKCEIVNNILLKLEPDNPLYGNRNGVSSKLQSVISHISNIKINGGLVPDALKEICLANEEFLAFAEPLLYEFIGTIPRSNEDKEKFFENAPDIVMQIKDFVDEHPDNTLAKTVYDDFTMASVDASQFFDTKPLTAFKKKYFTKDTMVDRVKTAKTYALATVYEKYSEILQDKKLIDFEDMILQLLLQLRNNDKFKSIIQEQYQYILVDEFQDTSRSQLDIIFELCDKVTACHSRLGRESQVEKLSVTGTGISEPNILVVGDDDQGIYSFQGATSSNLIEFKNRFPNSTNIQLFRNYRSSQKVLDIAEIEIVNNEDRIKNKVFGSNVEQLYSVKTNEHPDYLDNIEGDKTEYLQFEDSVQEYSYIADQVKKHLDENPEKTIAVIGKRHKDLLTISKFIRSVGIDNISYAKSENILNSEVVKDLLLYINIICLIAKEFHEEANALLPELLAKDSSRISAKDIWELSIERYEEKKQSNWLSKMFEKDQLKEFAVFLIGMSKQAYNLPIDEVIDKIMDFRLKDYYFPTSKLDSTSDTYAPAEYIKFTLDLCTLRDEVIANIKSEVVPTIFDFINTLNSYEKYGIGIQSQQKCIAGAGVELVTAHGAKGLEYDTVFIINSTQRVWLSPRNTSMFPTNLPFNSPSDKNESFRLFFVAITRAMRQLIITAPTTKDGKYIDTYLGEGIEIRHCEGAKRTRQSQVEEPTGPASETATGQTTGPTEIDVAEVAWQTKLLDTQNKDLKYLLSNRLNNFKVSASTINSFTNLEHSGPDQFLLNNLIGLPSITGPEAVFGNLIHSLLDKLHQEFVANNGSLPDPDQVNELITAQLQRFNFPSEKKDEYNFKARNIIDNYLAKNYFTLQDKTEQKLDTIVDGIPLTGKLDLITIDEGSKTILVTDYKTGSRFERFESGGKIKSLSYFQQLYFYKLLLNNVPQYKDYKVEARLHFVEEFDNPFLYIAFEDEEYNNIIKLVKAIYTKIVNLDFPTIEEMNKFKQYNIDTGTYIGNLEKSKEFISWLVDQV
jgi:DNA helicase-2/ATP-dependent DNA helicase PcrA